MNTQPQFNFIELCSGAGGLSSGLMKAGLIPLLLNDNNKDCCKTLKHNHPNTNVVLSSMTDINYDEYRKSRFINVRMSMSGMVTVRFSKRTARPARKFIN